MRTAPRCARAKTAHEAGCAASLAFPVRRPGVVLRCGASGCVNYPEGRSEEAALRNERVDAVNNVIRRNPLFRVSDRTSPIRALLCSALRESRLLRMDPVMVTRLRCRHRVKACSVGPGTRRAHALSAPSRCRGVQYRFTTCWRRAVLGPARGERVHCRPHRIAVPREHANRFSTSLLAHARRQQWLRRAW